ncbi:MAG: hypothetical protein H0V17_12775 [Deltaproteobacteria bacterium]|nr:hypothetical protein [Deltaproteobacteria bacterium]
MLRLAVSTYVLAALAVSVPAIACPLGEQANIDEPALPWIRTRTRVPLGRPHVPPPPKLTLRTIVGDDGAALVRTLSKLELACGSGRGELTLRIDRGAATVSVSGFDPIATPCITRAIEQARFARIPSGTIARLAIELR